MKTFFYPLTFIAVFAIDNGANAQTLKNFTKKIEQKANQIVDKVDKVVEEINTPSSSNATPTNRSSGSNSPFKNLSPNSFDYVRGATPVFMDDFSGEQLGQMASHWTSNGSGSVATIPGFTGKWLELNDKNTYKIKDLFKIPTDFTVEFDLLVSAETQSPIRVDFGFDYIKGVDKHYYLAEQNPVNIRASYRFNRFEFTSKEYSESKKQSEVQANMSYFVNDVMKVKIKVVQDRMNVYINEYKVLDTEMINPATRKYFYFAIDNDDTKNTKAYISNFRIDKI